MRQKSMFIEEYTGFITVYPQYTDLSTGEQISVRCVLAGCVWRGNSITQWERTGQQTTVATTVSIPWWSEYTGRKYVTPNMWQQLSVDDALNKYWTINPRQTPAMPILVNGISEHEFTWAHPTNTAITPPANRLSAQETAFMNANPDARRAADINPILSGMPPEKDEDWIIENDSRRFRENRDIWQIRIRC